MDGQRQREDIPTHARTAHGGPSQKKKKKTGKRISVTLTTQPSKGLNWTELSLNIAFRASPATRNSAILISVLPVFVQLYFLPVLLKHKWGNIWRNKKQTKKQNFICGLTTSVFLCTSFTIGTELNKSRILDYHVYTQTFKRFLLP